MPLVLCKTTVYPVPIPNAVVLLSPSTADIWYPTWNTVTVPTFDCLLLPLRACVGLALLTPLSTGVRGVPQRQALSSPVHVPQEEPQEEDHGENENNLTVMCVGRVPLRCTIPISRSV